MKSSPQIEEAILTFQKASHEQEVFVSITQKEACLIHLMSVIGIRTLHEASVLAKAFPTGIQEQTLRLEMDATLTDIRLWTKIMNAISVQVFDEDAVLPPDLPDLDELVDPDDLC